MIARGPAPLTVEGPVLVVAPHPDDETLGCGGLIAEALQRGLTVHTLFVTDGAASHPASKQWPRRRLAGLRELEACEALRRLGAGDTSCTFLRLPDAAMPEPGDPAHERAVARAGRIVHELSPRLALLPWRRDPHRDHRGAWRLAMDAIARSGSTPRILEYAIWLDALGSPDDQPRTGEMEAVRLDIAAHVETKRRALQAHQSQLGRVISDDPDGFTLSAPTIARLISPQEAYWRPCGAT